MILLKGVEPYSVRFVVGRLQKIKGSNRKMKVTGKNSLSNFIEICLKIIFVMGIIIYIALPWLFRWYVNVFNPILNYTPALVILYVSGIPALIIVYKFIKIFETLKLDNPFVLENVRHLKVISVCSLIISIEYIIGMFFIVSIFEIILIAVFIIVWLGGYILSELLRKAVEYKEENDLTI